MSATVAFSTPTTTALSASVRVTGAPPLDDLISSVLPSTFSMVPRTRCVSCAEAVVRAIAVANAAVVNIRTVFILILPRGLAAGGEYSGGRAKRRASDRGRLARIFHNADRSLLARGEEQGAGNCQTAEERATRPRSEVSRG